MRDFLTALALLLIVEGAAYALFTDGMKQALTRLLALPDETIRKFAWGVLAVGVLLLAGLRI